MTKAEQCNMQKVHQLGHQQNANSLPPVLRNLAFIRLYWKLRLREVQQGKKYSATFMRRQSKIQTNDPTFRFPRLSKVLSVDDIRISLNKASASFVHKSQHDSISLRMKCYEDLLSPTISLQNWHQPFHPNWISTQIQNRSQHYQWWDPQKQVSWYLSSCKALLRQQSLQDTYSETSICWSIAESCSISATTRKWSIWETVVEKDKMERQLLQYNRDSFRAASASPFGNGALYDVITFSELSISADQILSGQSPPEWSHDDLAMREFLASSRHWLFHDVYRRCQLSRAK